MMNRRAFIGSLAGGLFAGPLTAEAQPAPPKVGQLSPYSPSGTARWIDRFRDGLRDQGYTVGANVLIEPRFADEHCERLPALADELIKLKVDVIVAMTTPVALAAQRATTSISIVFTLVSDPVRTGLVANLARPGGNVTGTTDITADLVPKRLGLLKEVVPRLTRVGVLKNPDNPGAGMSMNDLEAAARSLGQLVINLRTSKALGLTIPPSPLARADEVIQ